MSSYNYNPNPPRVWSRVQNQCTYVQPGSTYSQSFIPLSGQTVSQSEANYEEKLYYKGNILQYKGNSASLTKKQKYSQLARCGGPNRRKVFATQSQTYTNPNTNGLLWANYVTFPFPNQLVGQPNNISGPFQYNVPSPFGCPTTSVKSGGNLVYGTYANQCTGEIIKSGPTSAVICNPSSCSDVPGRPIELCWNDTIQTFYPRQRYIMNNSADKWPEGYKGFVSAVIPVAPILTLDSYTTTTSTLSWTDLNSNCLPISSYNIYQNGKVIENVPYTTITKTINNLTSASTYTFYVTSFSRTIESLPSNQVTTTNTNTSTTI